MLARSLLAAVAALSVLLTSGCQEETQPPERSPQQVIDQATAALDATEGVRLRLSTPQMAEGVSGITAADGVITRAPAFEGTISVSLNGTSVEVPVVAVDDTVFAQLPLTTGWSEIDPVEYGAPDPAGLIDSETGFSSLLPATTGLAAGKSIRGGTDNSEVLTTYTGTVPGEAMQQVIPSSSGESFDAEYQVTADDELRQASFTGVFYPASEEMTYVVDFADYGTTQDIAAPETEPSPSPEG